jgi:hypothetical protein
MSPLDNLAIFLSIVKWKKKLSAFSFRWSAYTRLGGDAGPVIFKELDGKRAAPRPSGDRRERPPLGAVRTGGGEPAPRPYWYQ